MANKGAKLATLWPTNGPPPAFSVPVFNSRTGLMRTLQLRTVSPLSLADRSALHDAYRYMIWLLMAPTLLTEIVLAMELTQAETPDTRSSSVPLRPC